MNAGPPCRCRGTDAPGAWVPTHSHGGPTLVTVLEGDFAVRERGGERRYRAGEGWFEPAGNLHAAGNNTGGRAVLAASTLLPKGAELNTFYDEMPGAGAAMPPVRQLPRTLPRTGEPRSIPAAVGASTDRAWPLLTAGGLVACGVALRRRATRS